MKRNYKAEKLSWTFRKRSNSLRYGVGALLISYFESGSFLKSGPDSKYRNELTGSVT